VASLGKRMKALEDRMCTSADQASEARHLYLEEKRAEVMAKLEAFEARLRMAINWVIGCCSCIYFGHGRRRHRPQRGDG
jgi:hypothetical protein